MTNSLGSLIVTVREHQEKHKNHDEKHKDH